MTLSQPAVGPAVRFAMKFAVIYSLWIIIAALITGGENLGAFGQPLWVIVGFYFLAALFAGTCAGLLTAVARTRWQAVLVGVVIALPVVWSINRIFLPSAHGRVLVIGTAIGTLVYGGLYGAILWRPPREPRRGAGSAS